MTIWRPVTNCYHSGHITVNTYKSHALIFPTMKTLGGSESSVKAEKTEKAAAVADVKTVEAIDFSKIKIEPLFEEMVNFERFAKSDYRAVKIKDCTILSGIHEYYEPEELIGKTAIAIVNLPPRPMMGIDSGGSEAVLKSKTD